MSNTSPDVIGPDPFFVQYREDRRRHMAGLSLVCAVTCLLIGIFAWVTSMPSLRQITVISAFSPLPFLIYAMALSKRSREYTRLFWYGLALSVLAWGMCFLVLASTGLALAYEWEHLAYVDNRVSDVASKDSQQDRILTAIDNVRENPTPAALRALVPFLDNVQTNIILEDGTARDTSSLVREVLWADPKLLLQTMDAEARAMAALLPVSDLVPRTVEIDVAKRLEFALKTMIQAHGEKKIQGSFDVPSVGVNIHVENPEGKDGNTVSNREIGITYPFDDVYPGDVLYVNAANVERLLNVIRRDLDY